MKLLNKSKHIIISENLYIADSFLKRLLGLIPKKNIQNDECLLITNCPMIHTCFMSFPIDVVFLDRRFRVIAIERKIIPWRFSKYYRNSFYAIEFSSDFVGNKIEIEDLVTYQ